MSPYDLNVLENQPIAEPIAEPVCKRAVRTVCNEKSVP
jgi:hypothetical protein